MKVLLTATVQSHICQFHRPLVEMLHQHGCQVHVAARDNLAEKNGLALDFVDKVYDVPFSRSPKSTDNIRAYKQLKAIIEKENYDIIHCNTPMGGIVTRLAAQKTRKSGTKVFYTAHGFHFYKGAPAANWLIYYPIEKVMATLTDVLITITREDEKLARDKRFKTNVAYIHGVGANEKKYTSVSREDNDSFRRTHGYDDRFVILCTGELNKNKNQKTVIEAVNILRQKYPQILLLLAGNGPQEQNLRSQIQALQMEDHAVLLGYRTDLENYTNACDIVVSASFREGLPLNIMEAMLCKKPVVASTNRGHRELIGHGETGFLVQADDVEGFAQKIEELLLNQELRNKIAEQEKIFIQSYTTEAVKNELRDIYFA